ncbi:hypothetical protein BHE74_00033023 [Ensete ventricosum]|nr:hypothetical protein BHE74_00033023 [Ensete ventricosum]
MVGWKRLAVLGGSRGRATGTSAFGATTAAGEEEGVRGPRWQRKQMEAGYISYCLLRSLVEHSCINPKSFTFGYLDEKPVDTGLMKFLGLCPSALSWYLEFASAFSTSSTPFMTNALPS